MEIIKIEREAIVLDRVERENLMQLILYCRHRLTEHKGNNGLCKSGIKLGFVSYLIENLRG